MDTANQPYNLGESDESGEFVQRLIDCQIPLRTFIHAMVRQTDDVNDVLQEVNKLLWEKRHEYDFSRPFISWSRQFAYLQSLVHLRRRGRMEHYSLDEALCQRLAAEATHHMEHMEARLSALRDCLKRLPARHRQMIDQRYMAETPVQQIAEEVGQSPDAVSMRLYRIRKTLAGCIRRVMTLGA